MGVLRAGQVIAADKKKYITLVSFKKHVAKKTGTFLLKYGWRAAYLEKHS